MRYSAIYTDARGSETTSIDNDGRTLRMVVRGITFFGEDFDSFSPENDDSPESATGFCLHHGCLCSCRIEFVIPVPLEGVAMSIEAQLSVSLILGDPVDGGYLDRENCRFTLRYGADEFSSSGKSGWFENELLEIQGQLPAGVYMKACINCSYSDYSPYGHGLFGNMMCFRNLKTEYLKVKGKMDFWQVHDRYDRQVQETYLCPEFERRVPGTGYRG